MMDRIRRWKTLPDEHKDYLLVYAWGALWSISYLLFSPSTTFNILSQGTIWLWTGASIVGAILALTGLLTRDNLILERFGITVLMIAPIVYGLTQLGLFIFGFYDGLPTDPFDRFHLIFLALWPFFFLNKRRRQLKRKVIEVKGVPLKHETESIRTNE